MAIFRRLFVQLFKQKSQKMYVWFLVEILSVLTCGIIAIVNRNGSIVFGPNSVHKINSVFTFLTVVLALFIVFVIVCLIVYFIRLVNQNEKINLSQTWRLAPLSDDKIYLDNILSSFVTFLYFCLLQVIFGISLVALIMVFSSPRDSAHITKALNYFFTQMLSTNGLLSCLLIVLFIFAVYLTISFLNFGSSSLMDFLPNTSNKSVMVISLVGLVYVAIICCICLLLYKFWHYPLSALRQALNFLTHQDGGSLYFDLGQSNYFIQNLVIYFIYDVALCGINMLLMNKFVEAKSNN